VNCSGALELAVHASFKGAEDIGGCVLFRTIFSFSLAGLFNLSITKITYNSTHLHYLNSGKALKWIGSFQN
jgi:hypothetical protein